MIADYFNTHAQLLAPLRGAPAVDVLICLASLPHLQNLNFSFFCQRNKAWTAFRAAHEGALVFKGSSVTTRDAPVLLVERDDEILAFTLLLACGNQGLSFVLCLDDTIPQEDESKLYLALPPSNLSGLWRSPCSWFKMPSLKLN